MNRFTRSTLLLLAVGLAGPDAAARPRTPPDWVVEARPDLLELTQRAELVVQGRVLAGNVKHPPIRIEEILRGRYDGERLRVVFRFLNHSREPGEKPIQFPEGEVFLLFLKRSERVRLPDRFELVRNRYGQVRIPPEGGDALRNAVRAFSALADAPAAEHFPRIRALLQSDNPIVVATALRQVRKHRLAVEEDLPALLRFLRQGSEENRVTTARILEQWLASARRRDEPFEREQDVVTLLIAAARNDESVRVRTGAVNALQAWASPEAVEALEIVATTDASQVVRFQAERSLLQIRRRSESASP